MRGKGIGKGLQRKLHEDLPNFSSVWYSRTNGRIKRSCGANKFLYAHFNYYPVGAYLSAFAEVFFKKFLKKKISVPTLFKDKYYYLNTLCVNRKRYVIKEISLEEHLREVSSVAGHAIKDKDFYITRDINFFRWKYMENPSLTEYHVLAVYSSGGELLGIVLFSGVFQKTVLGVPRKVVTILDCFPINDHISMRTLLLMVMRYYKERSLQVDAILSLQDMGYLPCVRYSHKGVPLLTTCTEHVKDFYLSYSDQDMEQMI